MLKVGIFTPYVRNEVTLAATQFADWLVYCGIETTMLSSGRIGSGVHPVWDKRVRRGHKKAVYSWAYGATHLCWFSADVQALNWARLVASDHSKIKTRNLFFPYRSRWSTSCDYFMSYADRVICLDPYIFGWLLTLGYTEAKSVTYKTRCVNLTTAGRVLVPRCGSIHTSQTHLMVVLPKCIAEDVGPEIIDVLDFLLCAHLDLHITVVSESTLPRSYRSMISRLKRDYAGRVKSVTKPPYYDYVDMARQHDWVYLANTRNVFGSLMATLAGSSVPMICHDVQPARAHVKGMSGGFLLPCRELHQLEPVAHVSLDIVARRLDSIFGESLSRLSSFQDRNVSSTNLRQTHFHKFVQREFIQ